MKIFINQYVQTPELCKEASQAWWNIKQRKLIVMSSMLPFFVGLTLLLYRDFTFLALFLLSFLPLLLFFIKKKKAIKVDQERLQVIFHEDNPTLTVEIKDKITAHTEKRETCIHLDDVESIVETDNLYVIFIKGAMQLALKKDSFTLGTGEECLQYLKQIIRKRG